MDPELRILVLCAGNLCRSPLAERLLTLALRATPWRGRAKRIRVSSAGLLGVVGSSMEPLAEAELERLGGSADGFVSRRFQAVLAREADLVLTATRELRSRTLEEEPRALRRTFTLREFATLARSLPRAAGVGELIAGAAARRASAGLDDYDVADPMGASPEVHRHVATQIDALTREIADAIVGSMSVDGPSGRLVAR